MKKNKLTLSAGILMVVFASLTIVLALEFVSVLAEIFPLIVNTETETITVVDAVTTLGIISLTGVCIAESILYMIWGVKLIKRTNKHTPINNMKKWLITISVFSYVLAFIHFGVFMGGLLYSGLLLASAILLTCAVNSKEDGFSVSKHYKENEQLIIQLENLKKLKDEGAISDEEYIALRDKIINENIINMVDTQDK